MSMPTWDQFTMPILKLLNDEQVRSLRQVRESLADQLLTPDQRAEVLPSGQSTADNRIGWAASYLTRVGALERPSRGQYRITPMGRDLLTEHPHGITEAVLRTHAREGDEWWASKPKATSGDSDNVTLDLTSENQAELDPTEQIAVGISRIHEDVASQLLTRLHEKEPAFFEQTVVDLLVAMGYGGADGRATVTSQSNDGGIDGVIDQDTLGLNRVYVQAKRYAPGVSVQRPEIQAFVGALSGKADGGVFITTSRFTSGARDYAAAIPTRIILIDGKRLTDLMIKFGVGVQVQQTIHVVEVDEDFFE